MSRVNFETIASEFAKCVLHVYHTYYVVYCYETAYVSPFREQQPGAATVCSFLKSCHHIEVVSPPKK